MSRVRLAVVILAWSAAALFVYQAIALDRKPLTTVRTAQKHAAVTDEKWVLEMADALDKLATTGSSDGHGNRMTIGERLRERVRKRRQERLTYWSIAGVLGLVGVMAVARRPKSSADTNLSIIRTAERDGP